MLFLHTKITQQHQEEKQELPKADIAIANMLAPLTATTAQGNK